MLFKKGPKPGDFMEAPQYNPTRSYLTDIYGVIYFPPIPLEKFTEKGITGICRALYTTAASALNNVNYQVYQIPATRKYFGEEFLHGFNVKYDGKALVYENLDDAPQCYQYTKEMTVTLEKIFVNFLKDKDIYILYDGESIQFIDRAQMEKMKRLKIRNRIVWVD